MKRNVTLLTLTALLLAPLAMLHAAEQPDLPTVDLSHDTHRHVIIAQGTEAVYQGHPTTLLLTHTGRPRTDADSSEAVVLRSTDYGLYRSEDEGATWQLIPDVLTQARTGVTVRDNFGPRMIIHPTRGLVICVAPELSQPFMDVYSSRDEGATWQRERVTLSNTTKLSPLLDFWGHSLNSD